MQVSSFMSQSALSAANGDSNQSNPFGLNGGGDEFARNNNIFSHQVAQNDDQREKDASKDDQVRQESLLQINDKLQTQQQEMAQLKQALMQQAGLSPDDLQQMQEAFQSKFGQVTSLQNSATRAVLGSQVGGMVAQPLATKVNFMA